jgi:hypothetical protein
MARRICASIRWSCWNGWPFAEKNVVTVRGGRRADGD